MINLLDSVAPDYADLSTILSTGGFTMILTIIYLVYLTVMSGAAFLMYSIDKNKAQKGEMRIKERTLLMLAVYGGAIGSFFGRTVFRHKTKKVYFTIVIMLSMVLQIAVLAIMFYLSFVGGVA